VDYIRQWLAADERPPSQVSGLNQFSYTISAAAAPAIASVHTAGGGSTIAPNTWIEIKGSNLSPTTRTWRASDFINNQLPTQLDGISVNINGKPAYVSYISPTQVNVLAPADPLPPSAVVQVGSASFPAPTAAAAPALFTFSGTSYAAAVHADGGLIGPAALYPGASTPARPGEIIQLYGNGFGSLAPPAVTVGGLPASVSFAGFVSPGLYQINVTVPAAAPPGDLPITAQSSSFAIPSGTLLSVRN
jgi:uncharacterized protein (TIGR03437 family)